MESWNNAYRKAVIEEADGSSSSSSSSSSRPEAVGFASHFFMEVNSLEVQEELSTTATLAWAKGVWLGKWE